jgi:hypothetical protein
MPLKCARPASDSGFYRRLQRVLRRECIGRIYENSSVPEDQRWYWTLHAPGGLENPPPSNHVATLEGAKAEFEASWVAWKAWAKLEEME